eukprot:g18509.t1
MGARFSSEAVVPVAEARTKTKAKGKGAKPSPPVASGGSDGEDTEDPDDGEDTEDPDCVEEDVDSGAEAVVVEEKGKSDVVNKKLRTGMGKKQEAGREEKKAELHGLQVSALYVTAGQVKEMELAGVDVTGLQTTLDLANGLCRIIRADCRTVKVLPIRVYVRCKSRADAQDRYCQLIAELLASNIGGKRKIIVRVLGRGQSRRDQEVERTLESFK